MDDRQQREARLAQLRAQRAGKERGPKTNSTGAIYDEVSEEEYRSVVKGRLLEDDFIEHDDDSGYVDDGLEHWNHDDPSKESENGKRTKKKSTKSSKKNVPQEPDFSNGNPYINPHKKKDVAHKIQEEDFLDNLLNDLTPKASSKSSSKTTGTQQLTASTSNKKRPSDVSYRYQASSDPPSSDGFYPDSDSKQQLPSSDTFMNEDDDFRELKKSRTSFGPRSSSKRYSSSSSDPDLDINDMHIESDNLIDMNEDLVDSKPIMRTNDRNRTARLVNGASTKIAQKQQQLVKKEESDEDMKPSSAATTSDDDNLEQEDEKKVVKKEDPNSSPKEQKKPKGINWQEATSNIGTSKGDELEDFQLPSEPVKQRSKAAKAAAQEQAKAEMAKYDLYEPDGSLQFYWIDYSEVNGVLNLIGKAFDRNSKRYVSCCLSVNGIERNVYVLPKGQKTKDNDGEEEDDNDKPSQDDVMENFGNILEQHGIQEWGGKFVSRKYAFEVPGIPAETEWLKVVYSYQDKALPKDLTGATFSHVFGTNTSAFELFVLKRKIMGPCWLRVEDVEPNLDNISWCKAEFSVSNPKSINPYAETDSSAPKDVPPFTIMSLSFRTIINHRENKREIVCANVRVYQDADIDDPSPIEKQQNTSHTIVRPLSTYPSKFETEARKNRIVACKSERLVLNNLLGTIARYDPDIIVGHEFLGVNLDILLNRMRELKCDHFSRIGRFKMTKWPRIRQNMNGHFLSGRLCCDLGSDTAKSIVQSTTWSMTEMTMSVLGIEREDIDPDDTADYFDSFAKTPDRLLHFIRHCEADSYFQMAIVSRVQMIPLTRQLTNLAGNSWFKTMNGGRAERNEYILLHEFHRQKYICPDKQTQFERAMKKASEDEEGNAELSKISKKYKGGLVFDPKRGLYDTFILVMDFNSLYPSIVQEFNIDFTTVDRDSGEGDDEERIPELPGSDVKQGILPKLIATLVNRRKQVKSLMKDKNAPAAKQLQWDIKQLALKLTANSMYGCLGYDRSRFYARPLAVLTTYKGREILTNTRELAESLQLDVIYGDTDSIMINTQATELDDALRIGSEFKKLVNERYRLLEIDIDGIFQRMLLLQKKKYAAMKVENSNQPPKMEIKGLDMKRREYCQLSKNVSRHVLEEILSGHSTENVIENVHDYLIRTAKEIREGSMPLEDYIIYKRLGRNPKDYPDAKSQPHVQVALRLLEKGQSAKSGDVIPYVFCQQDNVEQTNQAMRAHHPDELRRAEDLHTDYEHYLSLQILPPIERLCDPIEGTDRCRLAECLGLDTAKYRTYNHGDEAEKEFKTFESSISDFERFKNVEKLVVKCRHCKAENAIHGTFKNQAQFLQCSNTSCSIGRLDVNSICLQLENKIRQIVNEYYEGWCICDDSSCSNRSRSISVVGKKCLKPNCRGLMKFEFSSSELYTQILYYHRLFDTDTAKKRAEMNLSTKDDIDGMVTTYSTQLRLLASVPEKYLNKSGRNFISLDSVFSTLRLI